MKATANKIECGLKGVFPVPSDKSISHRALMLSALADGTTDIYNLLESEDVLCTLQALKDMGINISKEIDDEDIEFYRVVGGALSEPKNPINLGNSGTSARLLSGIIAGNNIKACLIGDASLSKRPMGRVIKPLSMMGASFSQEKENDSLPLWITGTAEPNAISYDMPVASAQLKSAVLLAGLNSSGLIRIKEPRASRDHTEIMLRAFGVNVETKDEPDGSSEIILETPVKLVSPKRIVIPADPSAAAFMAVAAMLYPDSDVTLPNVCMNKTRTGLYKILKKMGANIKFENEDDLNGEPVADIHIQYSGALKACNVPFSYVPSMIDEYPILSMLASMSQGTMRMKGLAELRVKESNRLDKIVNGLSLCGVQALIDGDDLIIHGTGGTSPIGGAMIDTGMDHRIAMSFLILGGITQKPITIDNADAIATSFPDFVEGMNSFCTKIELIA